MLAVLPPMMGIVGSVGIEDHFDFNADAIAAADADASDAVFCIIDMS